MTTEEIIKKRRELDKQMYDLEKIFLDQKRKIDKEFFELSKQCPHKNMDGCSYSRWCNDCGMNWDTT